MVKFSLEGMTKTCVPTGSGTFHCNSSEALATCYVQEWCICAPSKRCRIASNSLVLWKIQNQCPCIFADVFSPTHPFSNSFLTWRAQTWGKADGDEDCLEDLLTEYTLMRDFSHKNVAKTFEASYPKARECLFGGVFCLSNFSRFHMRWLSVVKIFWPGLSRQWVLLLGQRALLWWRPDQDREAGTWPGSLHEWKLVAAAFPAVLRGPWVPPCPSSRSNSSGILAGRTQLASSNYYG